MKKMSTFLCFALLVGLTMTAATAVAQDRGTKEVGLFGRITLFDNQMKLDDDIGLGVRAAWYLRPNFALEADASFTRAEGLLASSLRQHVDVMPIHARLLYNIPVEGKVNLLFGGGVVHTIYGDDADASDTGAGALVGLRIQHSDKVSLRFDATADWYKSSDFTAKNNHVDYGVQAGVNVQFGAKAVVVDKDSDGDGVLDSADKCPGTPLGDKVDASGCSLPKDSDGDGVNDDKDKCPNTPRGEKVDASGCPLPKDSDGDGVNDAKDKCPGTEVGTKVDANGCPELFEAAKTVLVLEGVNFESSKAILTPESGKVLDRVATSLKAYPEIKVGVDGHTDSSGGRAMNMKLSQMRADAVRDYLVSKGVAADQLVSTGHGPDMPAASNDTPEGRAKNRRTELNKLN